MHHVDPVKDYIQVYIVLMVLLGVTVGASYIHFGHPFINVVVAMAIAVFKAALVVRIFMGFRHSTRLTQVWAGASLIFLLTLFGLAMSDYASRFFATKGW